MIADADQQLAELGDVIHHALVSVGITEQLVSSWLGRKGGGGCGCERRRNRLNQLSRWAKAMVGGVGKNIAQIPSAKLAMMKQVLVKMVSED